MKTFKNFICLLLAVTIFCCFTACGKDNTNANKDNQSVNSEQVDENKITAYTIGNLTVLQIKEILGNLNLNDGLKLELTHDNTKDQYHSLTYSIKDADGKKRASINATSDLENKAASFSITWKYNDSTAAQNEALSKASETMIIAVWPDYSEEYMEFVEKTVSFKTSYLNAFRNENTTYTANATSGFISAGMSAGNVTFTINYANLVENV